MNGKTKILFVEHDSHDLELIQYELKKAGISYVAKIVETEIDYTQALTNFAPDIILCDYSLPAFDGTAAFQKREEIVPETPFIFVSGSIGEENSIELIKNGLTDYALKDKLYTLTVKVKRALLESSEKQEKIRTEQERVQSERRLARAQAVAHMGSWELDIDTNIVLCSEEALRIYGLPPGKNMLSFATWSSFIHPDDLEFVMNKVKASPDSINNFSFNYRIINSGGELRYIYSEGKVEFDESGHATGMYGITYDETEKKLAEEQIEFDRNNLNALINNTNDLMWSVDLNYRLISFNKPFNNIVTLMSGKPLEKGSDISTSAFTPEQISRFKMACDRAFAGESFTVIGHSAIPFEYWSEISYYPLRSAGKIVGTACHSRDITERKKAEERLSKSEAFNRGVLNSLGSQIAVINGLGYIVAVNEAWERFGVENGETTLRRVREGSNYYKECDDATGRDAEIAAKVLKGMTDVMGSKKAVFRTEYPCYTRNGILWFNLSVLKFDGDEPLIVVSHSDISDRKLAQKNLLQSESRLKEAQAISHIGSWELDMVQNIDTWSEELYDIFHIRHKDVLPSSELFLSFVHPDDLDFVKKDIKDSLDSLQNSSSDFRFILEDGTLHYGYMERKFEFDKNNKPVRLYGILQDVTERKTVELIHEKISADIFQRNKDLEQFSYIVSHNLRAPVANIIGLSAAVQDQNLEASVKKELMVNLAYSVKKLDDVIIDLNTVLQTKGEASRKREWVQFSRVANDIHASIENLIEQENAVLVWDFSEVDELLTLKSFLHSIFYNLISNSLKYRKPAVPPVIEIKSRKLNGKVELVFADNGLGIDLEEKGGKVFGLYKRFHTGIAEGKGMGLYLVKTQVESLGGKISVESEVNIGTTFKIEFET